MVGFIIVLIGLMIILAMLHKEICKYKQSSRQNNQNPSEAKKPACETDKRVCLLLQLLRRLRLLLGDNHLNLRQVRTLLTVRTKSLPVVTDSLDERLESGSDGIVHKSNKRKQPNV